jgi:hypothetical protein
MKRVPGRISQLLPGKKGISLSFKEGIPNYSKILHQRQKMDGMMNDLFLK